MRHLLLYLALATLGTMLLVGCGGGDGASTGGATTGSLGVRVDWPSLPKMQTEVIPSYSQSVKVEILHDGQSADSDVTVANRPETLALLRHVLPGSAVLRATAYALADGEGAALATADMDVQVIAGTYNEFQITLQSLHPVAQVDITPTPANLTVGTGLLLYATARNAAGQVVTLYYGDFTWTVLSGGSHAHVSSEGYLSGITVGSAVVQATENDSGISGTITVNVIP